MRKSPPFRSLARLLLPLVALTSACQFGKLGDNLDRIDDLSRVRVEVQETTESGKPVLVFLGVKDKLERANMAVLFGPGVAEMGCAPGEYYVGALEDLDEDFAYTEGEPMQFYGDLSLIRVEPGETREIQLSLGEKATVLDERTREVLEERRAANPNMRVTSSVEVLSLDDPRFARENAELGAWQPAEFIERGYTGLYLLEPHDPARTPVVFVHGIFGTPLDFQKSIEGLDRTRYQPWVYYYPSSLRLDQLSSHLLKELNLHVAELQPEQKIKLVCHSMGGLVGRDAVAKYTRAGHDYLDTFVTICSPLNGMTSAAAGAKWAPTPMPCWYDLSPGSPFLTQLFSTPYPEHLTYHQVFGYSEGDGDGVVPIHSQLREEAMNTHVKLTGANDSHVGILGNPRFLELLNSL